MGVDIEAFKAEASATSMIRVHVIRFRGRALEVDSPLLSCYLLPTSISSNLLARLSLASPSLGMAASVAPTSQTTPAALPPSVFTLPQTAQLEALYTIIRDKTTSRGDFLFYSDRVIRLLVEEGLNHLPVIPKTVETPTVRSLILTSL